MRPSTALMTPEITSTLVLWSLLHGVTIVPTMMPIAAQTPKYMQARIAIAVAGKKMETPGSTSKFTANALQNENRRKVTAIWASRFPTTRAASGKVWDMGSDDSTSALCSRDAFRDKSHSFRRRSRRGNRSRSAAAASIDDVRAHRDRRDAARLQLHPRCEPDAVAARGGARRDRLRRGVARVRVGHGGDVGAAAKPARARAPAARRATRGARIGFRIVPVVGSVARLRRDGRSRLGAECDARRHARRLVRD